MPAQLRISVRFLDGTFHGRGDGDEPEWPPSPLRLFQAIVATAATRWSDPSQSSKDAAALRWLERLPPPVIVAARRAAIQPRGYRLYVPDNVGDLVAKRWATGDDNANIADSRTDKIVRPSHLADGNVGDCNSPAHAAEFPAVHYLWPLADNGNKNLEPLLASARSISRLGWGVDLVVADAAVEQSNDDDSCANSATERWLPVEISGGSSLRVPAPGTLEALEDHHAAFLSRLQTTADGRQFFRPVPPLATFRVVTYRRETDLAHPPYAVFALRLPDDSGFATFDPQRRRLHLAGMLRRTASQPDFASALGWDETKVAAFVLGHDNRDPDNSKPTASAPRLVFIPLPSIEWRGEDHGRTVGVIRRVLVTVSGGAGQCDSAEFSRIIRALEGRDLVDENDKRPAAFLRRQSDNERAVSPYLETTSTWTTVTPVVLPGHDDPRKLRQRLRENSGLTAEGKNSLLAKLDQRIDHLLRKALHQAGYSEAISRHAAIEWRGSGYLPGTDLASRYMAGDQHRRYRKLHVRIQFRDEHGQPLPIPGPLCLGGGKFSGTGLFTSFT